MFTHILRCDLDYSTLKNETVSYVIVYFFKIKTSHAIRLAAQRKVLVTVFLECSQKTDMSLCSTLMKANVYLHYARRIDCIAQASYFRKVTCYLCYNQTTT